MTMKTTTFDDMEIYHQMPLTGDQEIFVELISECEATRDANIKLMKEINWENIYKKRIQRLKDNWMPPAQVSYLPLKFPDQDKPKGKIRRPKSPKHWPGNSCTEYVKKSDFPRRWNYRSHCSTSGNRPVNFWCYFWIQFMTPYFLFFQKQKLNNFLAPRIRNRRRPKTLSLRTASALWT